MMGYGYENAAGDRISALIDMINGGGPGRSGDTFEGGGILSLLANAVAKPYGSVRERPGHTPMGATAAPMGVLRPVAPDAGVEPVETTALSDLQSFETEAAAPRYLTEDEKARLDNLPESIAPPDLLSLFSGIPTGSELSPQESVILDALLASASFNPAVQGRRGLNFQRTAAPIVSPRPRARPERDTASAAGDVQDLSVTIPPYTQQRAAQAPVTPPEPQDPLVPAPTDIQAVRDTAYDSLGDPTFFLSDQLEGMSPQLRAMAEEHNRENLMLAAEVFRVPAAPIVSPRPKPRPDAVPAAGPAGTDEPIRVPYLGTVFNVFPKTGRVVVEHPVANAEKGYFAAAGDELRPGTQYYYDVMELVNRRR